MLIIVTFCLPPTLSLSFSAFNSIICPILTAVFILRNCHYKYTPKFRIRSIALAMALKYTLGG